jgi:hypothetical protein
VADGKADRRKRVLLAVRISVVTGGLILAAIWVFSEQIWIDLKGAFARMDLWVFACVFAVFCASQLVVALRWWLLLRTQGVFIGFWAAVRLYFLGWFYNNVMLGSVGGDLIRVWYVTKHTEKKFEAGLSVVVDRAIGLLGTLIIAFFFYFAFLWPKKIPLVAAMFRYWWFVLPAAAAAVTAFWVHPRGRRLMGSLWSSLCSGWKKLVDAGRLYGRKPFTIFVAFVLTVVLQITTIAGFWFLGRNIGIEASIKYYCVFFALVWVIGTIPVSIAGAGVIEGTLVVLFVTLAGVPKADAMALALLQRFVWLLASLPGAVIHLIGAHLPKDFSVDCDSSVK